MHSILCAYEIDFEEALSCSYNILLLFSFKTGKKYSPGGKTPKGTPPGVLIGWKFSCKAYNRYGIQDGLVNICCEYGTTAEGTFYCYDKVTDDRNCDP